MTALVVAVAVLVNVVLGVVEDNWALSIDLSPSQVTDFAQSTVDTVAEVDEDIVLYLLFEDGTQTELKVQLEEMAKKYHAMNGHITYDFIGPLTEPSRLAQLVDTTQVSLPDGVSSIPARAFADCENLCLIVVPKTISFIAEDAFEGSADVAFVCSPDHTYAIEWAAEHLIPAAVN